MSYKEKDLQKRLMFHIYVRLLGAKPKLEHMGTNGGDNIEPSHPPILVAPVPRQERFASSILASILKLLR